MKWMSYEGGTYEASGNPKIKYELDSLQGTLDSDDHSAIFLGTSFNFHFSISFNLVSLHQYISFHPN